MSAKTKARMIICREKSHGFIPLCTPTKKSAPSAGKVGKHTHDQLDYLETQGLLDFMNAGQEQNGGEMDASELWTPSQNSLRPSPRRNSQGSRRSECSRSALTNSDIGPL